jgi:hypothetical protein
MKTKITLMISSFVLLAAVANAQEAFNAVP